MNSQYCFPLWSLRSRQQIVFELFEIVKKKYPNENLILLSKEIDESGKRKFLLSTYEFFYKQYRKMQPDTRSWYEIIRQNTPCKLYFDIEYNKEINKSLNGNTTIIIFKQFLVKYIYETLQISITMENIIDLDSSNDKKFSRHIIINLKDSLFNNNIQCGIFVSSLCNKIFNMIKENEHHQLKELIVNKTDNKKGLFIDQCVYNKNRCFRLPFSSKYKYIQQKKGIYLTPINKMKLNNMKYEHFLQMLVCVPQNKKKKIISINKFTDTKLNDVQTRHAINYNVENKVNINGLDNNDNIKNWMMNIMLSNIMDVNRKIEITLFKTYYQYDNVILLYNIKNYRYCENISREHRRNNVYFIINYNKS